MSKPDNSIGNRQVIGIIFLFILFSFLVALPKFLIIPALVIWLALLYWLVSTGLHHTTATYDSAAAIPIIRTGLSPDLSAKLSDEQLKTFIEIRDTNLKQVTRMGLGPRLFDAKLLVPLLVQHGMVLSSKEIDQVNNAEMPYLKQIGAA